MYPCDSKNKNEILDYCGTNSPASLSTTFRSLAQAGRIELTMFLGWKPSVLSVTLCLHLAYASILFTEAGFKPAVSILIGPPLVGGCVYLLHHSGILVLCMGLDSNQQVYHEGQYLQSCCFTSLHTHTCFHWGRILIVYQRLLAYLHASQSLIRFVAEAYFASAY